MKPRQIKAVAVSIDGNLLTFPVSTIRGGVVQSRAATSQMVPANGCLALRSKPRFRLTRVDRPLFVLPSSHSLGSYPPGCFSDHLFGLAVASG